MFQRQFNELALVFDLSPNEAPLLIKSGRESGADPTLLDMNFVRTTHPRTGEMSIFLPGSSLKGTLRSYAERMARTVRPEATRDWCCDPFDSVADSPRTFCGRRLKDERSAAARYAKSCAVCRTFGNTVLGSHLMLADAFPLDEPRLEQRDGVAIDRIFGTVAAGPFNMEVVTRGTFRATLKLRNFQFWQVGLLAVALRDLGNGRVPIGFGKSKGFGRIAVAYHRLEVSYLGQFDPQTNGRDFTGELLDLAAFEFPARPKYGLVPAEPASLPLPAKGREIVDNGELGRVTVAWTDQASIEAILRATVTHWRACATGPWPPAQEGADE